MPWFSEKSDRIGRERLEELMDQTVAEARRRIWRPASPRAALTSRHYAGPFRRGPADRDALRSVERRGRSPFDSDARAACAAYGRRESADVRAEFRRSESTPTIGRDGCVRLGEVPAEFVKDVTRGAADWAIPVVVNRQLMEEPWDLIINVGHVVPHEVLGFRQSQQELFHRAGRQGT